MIRNLEFAILDVVSCYNMYVTYSDKARVFYMHVKPRRSRRRSRNCKTVIYGFAKYRTIFAILRISTPRRKNLTSHLPEVSINTRLLPRYVILCIIFPSNFEKSWPFDSRKHRHTIRNPLERFDLVNVWISFTILY